MTDDARPGKYRVFTSWPLALVLYLLAFGALMYAVWWLILWLFIPGPRLLG